MKKLCANLKKHATEINSFEKNEILPLTKKQEKNTRNKNFAIYSNKNLMKSLMKIKTTVRSGIIATTQGNILRLPIVSVTEDIKHKKRFLLCSILKHRKEHNILSNNIKVLKTAN